jgi:hypothetical protein
MGADEPAEKAAKTWAELSCTFQRSAFRNPQSAFAFRVIDA